MEDHLTSPWDVNTLEEFLNYCCPECDEKNPSRNSFILHAHNHHPESIQYLFRFHGKNEEINSFDESEVDIKVEELEFTASEYQDLEYEDNKGSNHLL